MVDLKKKGISPLIATVLIIGFTVALAAIIITWSTGFTKRMQTQTEETANIQVLCATDVIFDLKSVCATADSYKVVIQNDGQEDITAWIVRFYKSETEVEAIDTRKKTLTDGDDVSAFGVERLTFTGTSLPTGYAENVKKIEVNPIITRSGKDIVCSQNVDSYGDVSGAKITVALNPCT